LLQVMKENESEEITFPRSDLSCMASTVFADLGKTQKQSLQGCLSSSKGDSVVLPRDAAMTLMKSVAAWLAKQLRDGSHPASATDPGTSEVKNVTAESSGYQESKMQWAGRVLVIGAGATGACVAYRLRSALGSKARIVVWDKARGAGGRMSTNRQDGLNVRADMGAPYLSMDGRDANCAAVADMLCEARVCADVPRDRLAKTPERPSQPGWRHLAGVNGGVNDALKKILDEAKAEVSFEQRVAGLDQQRGQWRAKPFSGKYEDFDAVIVAVPGCGVGGDNLNKIHGGWENVFSRAQNQELQSVQHDQRWAFALFFPADCIAKCDEFFGPDAIEKVIEDRVIHLLCYQTRKTAHLGGGGSKNAVAVVAHTTVEWARQNARANGRDQRLLDEVAEQVKWILGFGRARLLASKVITWKQCHVTRPVSANRSDGPCMVACSSPPLILAGDYFTESNFGGCLTSAYAAADNLVKFVASDAEEPSAKRRRL